MERSLYLVIIMLFVIGMICGCGKTYTCYDCEASTNKAYYDMKATIDRVMCEDCAREYWMPMPYQNYRVK